MWHYYETVTGMSSWHGTWLSTGTALPLPFTELKWYEKQC